MNKTAPDARVAGIAQNQHGRIRIDQLFACGLDRSAVRRRVRRGLLHRVHRGVYAVGHAGETLHARFMAAVLACGPAAVLSHYAAAALHGFLSWEDRLIDVIVRGDSVRSHQGVRTHRSRNLDERDVMWRDGIRVTTVERTLLDLAGVLPAKGLRRAVRQAQALQLTNVRLIAEALTRANGHRGATRLAALIADGPMPTRSELEDVMLALVERGGLARPQVNVRLGRVFPDLRWPQQRLTVECDGATWHDLKLAREDDAERQARLEASGERVLRVTWQQAVTQQRQTIARLVAAGAPPARLVAAGAPRATAEDDGSDAARRR